jgi:uncharacterized Zn-finger protein
MWQWGGTFIVEGFRLRRIICMIYEKIKEQLNIHCCKIIGKELDPPRVYLPMYEDVHEEIKINLNSKNCCYQSL